MTMVEQWCSKNVDIKLSTNNAFLESPSSGTLKVERLESQIILKSLGAIKPDGLNRIAKISYVYLREEIPSFNHNNSI